MLAFSACLKDLDQRPVVESESDATEVYSSVDGFRGVLAKIYASYCIVGQEKGGGNADLSSNNGFDLLRGYFNMQESATDELAGTWLSGDKIEFLTFMNWDASDPWVSDTYYRLYYTISLCNEFLRNTGLADGFSDTDKATVATYAGEARFLRALAYWMVLDLYGKGPYVDETMTVGGYMPEAYNSKQLFDYIESELKDITLPKPSATEYGRASEAAAWTLLARLYLNAGVYGAGDHFSDCIECCKKVLADGFSLESDYGKLFNAENHLRTNEIIFPFVIAYRESVSWLWRQSRLGLLPRPRRTPRHVRRRRLDLRQPRPLLHHGTHSVVHRPHRQCRRRLFQREMDQPQGRRQHFLRHRFRRR